MTAGAEAASKMREEGDSLTDSRWLLAGSLAELEAAGLVQAHVGGHSLALVHHEAQVFAIDDRCPHMGFPMHQGSVADGIVTCHWHHARFDLAGGGTLDPFADDLTSFPVELRGGDIWVNLAVAPPSVDDRLRQLSLGLEQDIPLLVAKACLGLVESEAGVRAAFAAGFEYGARYRRMGWGSGLTILACLSEIWEHLAPVDRPRALFQGLSAVARDSAGSAPHFALDPLPDAPTDLARLMRWFRTAVEVRDPAGAERCLASAIETGATQAELSAMLFAAATDHRYIDSGHPLDFTNKALEALDAIGWAHAPTLLPSLVATYTRAQRMEESNAWRHPIDLVSILENAFTKLPAAWAVGQRQSFSWDGRSALIPVLLGDDPQAIASALVDCLAGGYPPTMLSGAVAQAASLRIAAFPVSNEFPDWDTALHSFTFANAVDRGLHRCGDILGPEAYPPLLRGVFDAAMSIYLDRFLNVPAVPLPEPDGSDEDAAALLAGLPELLDQRHKVDAAGALVGRYLFAGGDPDALQRRLAGLLLREDRDFHTIQMIEASFKQHAALRGKPVAAAVLIAAARYLAAHAPTMRARSNLRDRASAAQGRPAVRSRLSMSPGSPQPYGPIAERNQERKAMVEGQLRARSIRDEAVLAAFEQVPRHAFVPAKWQDLAYADQPLPIGGRQTISQPYIVAEMLQLADIQPGDKVLEVGTGSGYQAALLAVMGAKVFTIERLPELAWQAQRCLSGLGYSEVQVRIGDGSLGWPEAAPFDAIVVAAGGPNIVPPPLKDQLAEGGRLIIPVDAGGFQILTLITRQGEGFRTERHEACAFVPLVGEHGWHETG